MRVACVFGLTQKPTFPSKCAFCVSSSNATGETIKLEWSILRAVPTPMVTWQPLKQVVKGYGAP